MSAADGSKAGFGCLLLNCSGHLVHTQPIVRRFLALQGCLALLLALFLAPYQHVHSGQCDGRGSGGFFENSTVVHAHPFLFSHVHADLFSLRHGTNDGARVEESSDEHAAWWLNSSSLLLHGAILLFVVPQSTAIAAQTDASFTTLEVVDEQGHDPPPLDCSVPRAPPA